MKSNYCNSLVEYSRRSTNQVFVGDIGLGSDFPIRIQSMTTVDTMDTDGSIKQAISMIESGCEIVRLTAPSVKEAQNLENIKKGLRARGFQTPLVADIHFTPNAAELAARIVEKVRINPGNYADKKRFEIIEYTDASYNEELDRIRNRFLPLLKICKDYGTALRIGTNHGSLSDRILSRFGDTPEGMVESALEFLKICEDEKFYNTVISMKSSNPQVMVQAYRLLVNRLENENLKPYPLHLGVTEAGEGEDGRIKSAMGIGTLLEDGLGDTVRVSLTEDPELESPVAIKLVENCTKKHDEIQSFDKLPYNPFSYSKRKSVEIENFGSQNVPRIIADFSGYQNVEKEDLKAIGYFYLPISDKWQMTDLGADYVYSGQKPIEFMLPNGLKEILDYAVWRNLEENKNQFPLHHIDEIDANTRFSETLNFVQINASDLLKLERINILKNENKSITLILKSDFSVSYQHFRRFFVELLNKIINLPVILCKSYEELEEEQLMLKASSDFGGVLIDGFGDGIMILNQDKSKTKRNNSVAFGILQAARTRITKTEYISCPSCGRTLFDLQETTAKIRKKTDHLKGVKIGIMGCIVNGPGEMADADYGYVGMGKDKISLYKGQNVMKRNVPSAKAVDELIELIKQDGKWLEPTKINEN